MDTQRIIAELEAERRRVKDAIAALQNRATKSRKVKRGKRSPLSTAARKRISEGMKKKWLARKRAGAA